MTYLLGLTVNAFSFTLLPLMCNTCSCLDPSLYTVIPFSPSSCDNKYAYLTSSAVISAIIDSVPVGAIVVVQEFLIPYLWIFPISESQSYDCISLGTS